MEEIPEGRIQALKSVLRSIGWTLTTPILIESCALGLSNKNYKVSCDGHGPLLLRVFGPTASDSNSNEMHIQGCGFGAQVIEWFEWGRLEMWLPGRPMQRKDCDNRKILASLAKELRRLHTVTERNHNDLNFTNILVCDSEDYPTTSLLDFEYAGPLDPSFDIANFFCEWMYDCGSPRWFEPDSTMFPSDIQARYFIAQYLGLSNINDSEVSAFLKKVQTRIPDVDTFWIDWAMTYFSDEDEYVQYAKLRQSLKGKKFI